jgi:Protein of unknown function (DUF2637)
MATTGTGWTPPGGPEQGGVRVVEHANGKRYAFDNFREIEGAHLKGEGRLPGSVLIGWAAWLLALIGAGALFVSFSAQYAYVFHVRRQDAASVIEALLLDLLMIVFTLLALGLSRAGKSSRTERILILACAAASAWMNVSAADTASPRSVVAYAVAPIALAVVVDRVVAVIRRHVLADEEPSAWTALGHSAAGAARLAGVTALYSLRLVLAPQSTAKGLRRQVLALTPLPAAHATALSPAAADVAALPAAPAPGSAVITSPELRKPARPRGESKTARFLALVQERYGELAAIDPAKVSRICSDLAPEAGLNVGSARSALRPLVLAAQNGHSS